MKKALSIVSLVAVLAAPAFAASENINALNGQWKGSVVNNLKDPSGGGNPTPATTGTEVSIHFTTGTNGLTGTSNVKGDPTENWTLTKDAYSWNDGTITVTAKRVTCESISNDAQLKWMADKVNLGKLGNEDTCLAYRYDSCTINKDKSACKMGEHLPNGIEKTGTWIFTVSKDTMTSNVCYNYNTGGIRVLSQELKKAAK